MKLLIFVVIVLTGCSSPMSPELKCSDEQWQLVEEQTIFCKENTSFYATTCLEAAIKRNCGKD